jgi:hypothetical protein
MAQLSHDYIQGQVNHLIQHSHDQPPVFLGHYWIEGNPEPLTADIACLDYSVVKALCLSFQW